MNHTLIVGLGNPGSRYDRTRHNFGERVLRAWATAASEQGYNVDGWRVHDRWQAQVSGVRGEGKQITALYPLTQMNESGRAVTAAAKELGITPADIILIHDDMQVPFGAWRWKVGGSASGHNGVRSVIEHLGTADFQRLRLGIGRPPEGTDPRDFVLATFTPAEKEILAKTIPDTLSDISQHVRQ